MILDNNARDTHSSLKIKTEYATWIKRRVNQLNLVEGKDYSVETRLTGRRNNVPTYTHLLTYESNLKIIDIEMTKVNSCYGSQESAALSTIEQLLNINLQRQFIVGKYKIDGYCTETNTAYEIDEPHHLINRELRSECIARQEFIEDELGCKFIRVKI